jgi:hypothetical protein
MGLPGFLANSFSRAYTCSQNGYMATRGCLVICRTHTVTAKPLRKARLSGHLLNGPLPEPCQAVLVNLGGAERLGDVLCFAVDLV